METNGSTFVQSANSPGNEDASFFVIVDNLTAILFWWHMIVLTYDEWIQAGIGQMPMETPMGIMFAPVLTVRFRGRTYQALKPPPYMGFDMDMLDLESGDVVHVRFPCSW